MRNCKRRPRPKLAHRSYHPHCVAGKRFSWCKHSEIGYNYRLNNVLAAIGRGQLRVLEQRVQRKREIFAFYRGALADLPGIAFMSEAPWGRGTRWLTVITVDPAQFGATREDIRLALERENIESRPLWKPPPYPRNRGGLALPPPRIGGLGGRDAVPGWAVSALGDGHERGRSGAGGGGYSTRPVTLWVEEWSDRNIMFVQIEIGSMAGPV